MLREVVWSPVLSEFGRVSFSDEGGWSTILAWRLAIRDWIGAVFAGEKCAAKETGGGIGGALSRLETGGAAFSSSWPLSPWMVAFGVSIDFGPPYPVFVAWPGSASRRTVVRGSIGVALLVVPDVAGEVEVSCDDPLARLATRPHVLSWS